MGNAAGAAMGLLVFALIFAASIGALVGLIVALVDMVRRPDWQWKLAGQEKVVWILLVCLVNVFAIVSLIYWFNIRKKLVAAEQAAAAGQFGPGHMGFGGWEPGPAPAPFPRSSPPGWYGDPTKEHDLRFFDGMYWTEHVSDDGPKMAPSEPS
jgi:hypothetical protein